MVFSSTIFMFLFLPIALAGYYLIRLELRNLFLVIASLLFYAWGEPRLIVLLLSSIIINYLFALIIEYKKDNKSICKVTLILMLLYNLGMLFVFKYLIFTVSSINTLTGLAITIPSITLPLGISFFTFRSISYVLDVYFRTSHAQKNIINVALYISFFPHLSMGPIAKYNSFEVQLSNRKNSFELFSEGAKRVIIGIAKKLILANGIAVLVDKAYGMQGSELSIALAWMGAIGYLLQLYYDFSGYSDMAIGLSNMFGFSCEENFNYPYMSKSIVDFWARWHISLGTWLKDYLYTPVFRGVIGKINPITRKAFTLQQSDIVALLVTWICCGMWHGAGSKFLIYGLYYYVFIVNERIRQSRRKKMAKKLKLPKHKETKWEAIRAHIYTLVVVLFGQIIFRAENMQQVFYYIKGMFGLNKNTLSDNLSMFLWQENWMLFLMGIILCVPIIPKLKKICDTYVIPNKVGSMVEPIIYLMLLLTSMAYMVTGTYNPFIYLNF